MNEFQIEWGGIRSRARSQEPARTSGKEREREREREGGVLPRAIACVAMIPS